MRNGSVRFQEKKQYTNISNQISFKFIVAKVLHHTVQGLQAYQQLIAIKENKVLI